MDTSLRKRHLFRNNLMDALDLALKERRPQPGKDNVIVFQHDNARPHIEAITNDQIEALEWKKLPHPPYSPDLVPSDYHLFRSLQHFLKGKSFNNERKL
jgi:[histone H3]-lysine36 N-dimethyltransferase SETMAR